MRGKRLLAGLLAVVLCCMPRNAVAAEIETKDLTDGITADDSYATYLKVNGADCKPDSEILLSPGSATVNGEALTVEIFDGKPGVRVESGQTASWNFAVESEGYYHLTVNYLPVEGSSGSMERHLYLDGKVPFQEARGLLLKRLYTYDNEKTYNVLGNQIQPERTEIREWTTRTLRASAGYITENLRFYLKPGHHTLSLESVREPIVYGELRFGRILEAPAYSEVKELYRQMGYAKGTDELYLPAEEPSSISDFSIYPTTDRSSAYTEPASDDKLRLNVIGGSSWASSGQSIHYDVKVEQSGLYRIGLRFKQDTLQGLSTYRRLYIDGELPFSEAASLKFPYDSAWQFEFLGNGEEDYWFYFEAGHTYTLSLEVTCGEYAGVLEELNASLESLNEIYRNILMITGPDPDIYRDYQFSELIPDVIAQMKEEHARLSTIQQELAELGGSEGSRITSIDNLLVQLEYMSERPERKIAPGLSEFQSNVSALGTWIMNATSQPLMLDAIQIAGENIEPLKADTGFFGTIVYECKRLIASFFNDYRVAGTMQISDAEAIEVWIYTGRDQAQILRNLIDNRFLKEGRTPVELKLVAAGTLMPATLAGKGPDISLGASSTEPINLAIRNAVLDLTEFPDLEEVLSRFHESAVIPFTYREALYAIPETQSFLMMFCRTDVLESLGLSIPKSWDELFDSMLELQSNNLNVGIPTSYSGLTMFLTQQGGELYSEDGKTSLLDSDVALASFKRLTDFFVLYGFPVQYDFANRFRSGEMPLAIQDYTAYNQLVLFAPEIKGLWQMAPIPGEVDENGDIRNTAVGTVSGAMIMKNTKNKEACWEFLKWWTSTEIQSEFGIRMESILGESAKYQTANRAAMTGFSWSHTDREALMAQWENVVGIPEVPGGYYSSRYVDFAFNKVINEAANPIEALESYVPTITAELQRKAKEFGY